MALECATLGGAACLAADSDGDGLSNGAEDILGTHDDALRTKLDDHRAALDATVREKDAALFRGGLRG